MSDAGSGQPFVIWVQGELSEEDASRLSLEIQEAVAPILERAQPESAEESGGDAEVSRLPALQSQLLGNWIKDGPRVPVMGMFGYPRLDRRAR